MPTATRSATPTTTATRRIGSPGMSQHALTNLNPDSKPKPDHKPCPHPSVNPNPNPHQPAGRANGARRPLVHQRRGSHGRRSCVRLGRQLLAGWHRRGAQRHWPDRGGVGWRAALLPLQLGGARPPARLPHLREAALGVVISDASSKSSCEKGRGVYVAGCCGCEWVVGLTIGIYTKNTN